VRRIGSVHRISGVRGLHLLDRLVRVDWVFAVVDVALVGDVFEGGKGSAAIWALMPPRRNVLGGSPRWSRRPPS
jgi:hypothetical protein